MVISFIRTLILYLIIITALRLMGKRQIGELQPSELVVAIMISDLASIPVADTSIPITSGIIPILTLMVFEVALSFATLKSEKIRNIISGKPAVIIKNGVISQSEMRKLRFNTEDLLEELRIKNYFSISQVDTAILETNGELTVIPKVENRSVTVGDLNIIAPQERLPFIIISDGKIRKKHLKEAGYDYNWLLDQLKTYNIENPEEVFLFSIDDNKNITLQIKSKSS